MEYYIAKNNRGFFFFKFMSWENAVGTFLRYFDIKCIYKQYDKHGPN